ncbi:MAG TPA: HD domain-containing protein [Solirubrobacterales bacterium]|nr:HD domain-containing protein [Solirubrobacterales bacterium]
MAGKRKNEGDGQEELTLAPPEEAGSAETVLVEPRGEAADSSRLIKETLLPISGMVRLSRRELEVIDHPAFQRLFEVYQLGQTHLVYRGATHMRGEHALGTVSAAMGIMEAINRNAPLASGPPGEHWEHGPRLSAPEEAFVRLGALLHDIGHLPAGHTLEDELGLLPRHDADERLELILNRKKWRGRSGESLRELIDEKYGEEAVAAGRLEKGKRLTPSDLVIRLISCDHSGVEIPTEPDFRIGVCRDIIGNTICADLIDYLHRDWLHLGKPRYFDPRLLEYMRIVTRDEGDGPEDRLVIHLGAGSRPRPDAVTAILDLLESRYQLSEIALFHRVKLAAAGMLERVIAEYRDTFVDEKARRTAIAGLIPELLECSDPEVLSLLELKLQERRAEVSEPKRIDAAIDLARRLRVRQLHRDLHILYADDLGKPQTKLIAKRFSGDPDLGEKAQAAIRVAAENRLKAIRLLERSFGLPDCSIVMYCPPLEMNTKIAEVGIFSKGLVGSLNNLDEDNHISGGHLDAQQERFRRLWRISFAIDRAAHQNLKEAGLLGPLRAAIEKSTLWTPRDFGDGAEDAVRDIAETVVQRDASPWYEREIVEPALNREAESLQSPGGAPSVISFIGQKRKRS